MRIRDERPDKKRCSVCNASCPLSEFHYNGGGYRRSSCKSCEAKRGSQRRVRTGITQSLPPRRSNKLPVPVQPIQKQAKEAKTYVITYAQNATPIHEEFLQSLKTYCAANEAVLLVIPGRYKNATSIWSAKMESDEWWDERLHDYLFDGRLLLGDNVCVFGDMSIQPTASRPLTGFEVFVGKHSAIFGHPRLQFRTVATATRRYPRILTTTGAVTVDNYTKSKAGKKGEAHHVFGACVVEEDEGRFHIRQINAVADGSFIDLDREYAGEIVRKAPRALALVCGDIHVDHPDEAVLHATLYANNSITAVLRPQKIVYHDVLDFDRRGHHSIKDFQDRYDRVRGNLPDSVEGEVKDAIRFIDDTPGDAEAIVVPSNHDEAFDRWLKTADIRDDPENARFFHETWAEMLAMKDSTGDWVPAFELCYHMYSTNDRARFLRRDEPYEIAGIYVNFHGDIGINGSRGSVDAFAKLGVKTISGHNHQPTIIDGAYSSGVTGALDQRYNRLPSSWMHSHVGVYGNGKRVILSVIDGTWRAPRI